MQVEQVWGEDQGFHLQKIDLQMTIAHPGNVKEVIQRAGERGPA